MHYSLLDTNTDVRDIFNNNSFVNIKINRIKSWSRVKIKIIQNRLK